MSRESMIKQMEKMLGVVGRPNEATRWYAARNGSYYAGAAWCNMTITWAAYQSGNYEAVCFGKDYAYTVYHAQKFKEEGRWYVDVEGIQRGDIVFFDWAGTDKIAFIDHVGIVTDVNGRDVVTIEGNTSDRCARRVRRREEIVGYGRPDYTEVATPPKPVLVDAAPAHDYRRTTYSGRTVNQRTKVMLETAATLFGAGFTLGQGSYNPGGVAASAGTHDGGGVVDISVNGMSAARRNEAVKALRQAGFAAWLRSPAEGFSYHIHAVAIGDREMSSSAAKQVAQYFAGKNGLANHGPDSAPASVGRPYPDWAAPGAPAPKPPAPKPPSAYKPPPFPGGLRPNSSSPSAKGFQRALKAAGYMPASVELADNYGPKTQAAVAAFHRRNPQYAEGPRDTEIGPLGWAELHREAYGR